MYSSRPGLVLGFHGCDESILKEVLLKNPQLRTSENAYDWLGHGIYFWENSPSRALEYAKLLARKPRKSGASIKKPAVLGAVIDLGFCLDLLDHKNLSHVEAAYEILIQTVKKSDFIAPRNKPANELGVDLLIRDLDCAVIETLHQARKSENLKPFDSVKGVFWEGEELYPEAGFREKDHIQVCVRNPNCIKGYFLPRKLNNSFSPV